MTTLESPPADGDRNTGPALATTMIIFDVMATISVLARLYVRSRLVKQFGFDDVFVVMSLVNFSHLIRSEHWGSLTPPSRSFGL